MTKSSEEISRSVKVLGIINLLSIVVVWLPFTRYIPFDSKPGELFAEFDREIGSILLLGILYALQGLFVFLKELGKWDVLTSGTIFLLSLYFWYSFDEVRFLVATIPVWIYLALQIKRSKATDNFRVAYLNSWNPILVAITLIALLVR